MSQADDLAPWAHPKARGWMETLFEKSGLLQSLRDSLENPDADLTCNQLRAIVALLYFLSIGEIWPAGQQQILQKLAMRIHSLSRKLTTDTDSRAMTVAEHQQAIHGRAQLEAELECLRRKVGISQRKSPLAVPPDWTRVWN